MKRIFSLALALAFLLSIFAACGGKDKTDGKATEPTSATGPQATQPATEPPRPTVTGQDITVSSTPMPLAQRPEFSAGDKVTDDELVSLHGYSIGMTFAETQQIWQIPQEMVDYAAQRMETDDLSSLYIFIGNMAYDFVPAAGSSSADFDSFVLQRIYYGETIFCETRESLSVLRDIKLGDMIEDVLKLLPGNRTPKKWAIDQLYGTEGKPGSASLVYSTQGGSYELSIYCENSWARLHFGYSGKLWIAEVYSYN